MFPLYAFVAQINSERLHNYYVFVFILIKRLSRVRRNSNTILFNKLLFR